MDVIYKTPTRTDIAVCMCFFSPAGFQRPKQNFLNVEKMLTLARIPTFTIECLIGDQDPLLKNPTVQVKSNSYLFYKEQLYNLLVPKIPEQYTKLIFIDADIVFDDPSWVDKISNTLDRYDIIQPFKTAIWTSHCQKFYTKISESSVYAICTRVETDPRTYFGQYHPGFSFAMTRDYFTKIGGFFDKCVFGSGDSMFCNLFIKKAGFILTTRSIDEEYEKWLANALAVPIKFTYLPFKVYHMYHGSLIQRQYNSRYVLFKDYADTPFDSLFYVNSDGVYEVYDPKLNQILKEYFLSRNEDFVDFRYSRFQK